jgi:hypothetical protein
MIPDAIAEFVRLVHEVCQKNGRPELLAETGDRLPDRVPRNQVQTDVGSSGKSALGRCNVD